MGRQPPSACLAILSPVATSAIPLPARQRGYTAIRRADGRWAALRVGENQLKPRNLTDDCGAASLYESVSRKLAIPLAAA